MNFIRNTKIRTMMVLILILFSLLWGSVSGFALYSLSQLTAEIGLTNVQQTNGDIINGANGQYYRTWSALARAVENRENNNAADAETELRTVAEELARLKEGLAAFKVTDHANINNAVIDEIYNSSYRLFSEAMVPMYEAVKK